MDFGKKLQELRKRAGLTQEELAERLFVSRTAVSKWESGRGLPGIDSLKAISKLFSVSIDGLLSGDELVSAAEEDGKIRARRTRSLVFASLDFSSALLLLLPFFRLKEEAGFRAVPLVSLTGVSSYLLIAFYSAVIFMTVLGVLEFAFQNADSKALLRARDIVSVSSGAAAALLFILSLQPYAAVAAFVPLIVKALLLIKRA